MDERTIFQSMPRRHVVSVGPQASVWEAACVMTKAGCGSVLVVEAPGTLLGILTERDLMVRVVAKALDPKQALVADTMTRNPHCAVPEMRVSDAVLVMMERGFRHLPVVSSAGKILGCFALRDALPREVGNAVSLAE